jgi:ABC-type nitrate/sulfonate/bicarbonate transport system substrate-binding protein
MASRKHICLKEKTFMRAEFPSLIFPPAHISAHPSRAIRDRFGKVPMPESNTSSLTRPRFLAGLAAGAAFAMAPGLVRAAGTVNIINTGANDSFALQALIKNHKYFESLGISDNTQNVSDGVKLVAAIVNDGSDIAILTGFSQVFPAIENGAQLKIVAGAMLPVSFEMYVSDPSVKTLKDLEGKTIGTGALGALLHMSTAAVLRKNGVDLNKVTFVNIGSSSDVFKAVAAKKVDAGAAQPEFSKTAAQFGVRILAEFPKEIPMFTNQGAFASIKAITEKRDLLVRTLAAYGKAFRFVNSPGSKQEYIKAYHDGVGPDTEAIASDQWNWIQQYKAYNTAIVLTPERINYMQQLNVALGTQKAVLPLDRVMDMSLARDAAKLAATGNL